MIDTSDGATKTEQEGGPGVQTHPPPPTRRASRLRWMVLATGVVVSLVAAFAGGYFARDDGSREHAELVATAEDASAAGAASAARLVGVVGQLADAEGRLAEVEAQVAETEGVIADCRGVVKAVFDWLAATEASVGSSAAAAYEDAAMAVAATEPGSPEEAAALKEFTEAERRLGQQQSGLMQEAGALQARADACVRAE
jgi:hypothetical protein